MSFQFTPVLLYGISPDNEGILLFKEGRLLAVLTRLSSIHDDREGQLFIEAVFGDISVPADHLLPDIEAATAWAGQVTKRAQGPKRRWSEAN